MAKVEGDQLNFIKLRRFEMDGKISVDNLIDFLVRAYREMLDDDGELLS